VILLAYLFANLFEQHHSLALHPLELSVSIEEDLQEEVCLYVIAQQILMMDIYHFNFCASLRSRSNTGLSSSESSRDLAKAFRSTTLLD
jgi:hypothetical protein